MRRHAAASVCIVTVALDAGTLRLSIADDGDRGPAAGIPGQGLGMRSMAERAAEVGGEWSVARSTGGQTLVTAALPVATVSQPGINALSGVGYMTVSPTLLVVDDQPVFRRGMAFRFEAAGYRGRRRGGLRGGSRGAGPRHQPRRCADRIWGFRMTWASLRRRISSASGRRPKWSS